MAESTRARWQDWVNLILGIWLFFAPAFNLAPSATGVVAWNGYIFGVGIVVFAIWALVQPHRWEEWINLVIGVWLIIAPFILGFTDHTGALWNHIIVGIIVGADAIWAMAMPTTPTHRAA